MIKSTGSRDVMGHLELSTLKKMQLVTASAPKLSVQTNVLISHTSTNIHEVKSHISVR